MSSKGYGEDPRWKLPSEAVQLWQQPDMTHEAMMQALAPYGGPPPGPQMYDPLMGPPSGGGNVVQQPYGRIDTETGQQPMRDMWQPRDQNAIARGQLRFLSGMGEQGGEMTGWPMLDQGPMGQNLYYHPEAGFVRGSPGQSMGYSPEGGIGLAPPGTGGAPVYDQGQWLPAIDQPGIPPWYMSTGFGDWYQEMMQQQSPAGRAPYFNAFMSGPGRQGMGQGIPQLRR